MKIRGTQNQWPNIASPGKLCKYCVFYCLADGKSRDTGADYTNKFPPGPVQPCAASISITAWRVQASWMQGGKTGGGKSRCFLSSPQTPHPGSPAQTRGHPCAPGPVPPPCSIPTPITQACTHHRVTCSTDSLSITGICHLLEFSYLIMLCL